MGEVMRSRSWVVDSVLKLFRKEKPVEYDVNDWVYGTDDVNMSVDDQFHMLCNNMQRQFNISMNILYAEKRLYDKHNNKQITLYRAHVDKDLWNIFINQIDKSLYSEYITCNTCKDFINKYGTLCMIENGEFKSMIWNTTYTPPAFKQAIYKMNEIIRGSKRYDKFTIKSSTKVLGDRKALGDHFLLYVPFN